MRVKAGGTGKRETSEDSMYDLVLGYDVNAVQIEQHCLFT